MVLLFHCESSHACQSLAPLVETPYLQLALAHAHNSRIKKEPRQAKSNLENRTAELRTKAGNIQSAQEDITKLDQQLKEQRANLLRVVIKFSFVIKRSCLYSRENKKKIFRLPLAMDISLIREEWLSSIDYHI